MILKCECHADEHMIVAYLDDDPDGLWEPELSIHTQATPVAGFWKRLKVSVAYMLGRQPKYGHWQETLVSKEDAKALRDLLNRYIDGR